MLGKPDAEERTVHWTAATGPFFLAGEGFANRPFWHGLSLQRRLLRRSAGPPNVGKRKPNNRRCRSARTDAERPQGYLTPNSIDWM
jgi:hypothetical protein